MYVSIYIDIYIYVKYNLLDYYTKRHPNRDYNFIYKDINKSHST